MSIAKFHEGKKFEGNMSDEHRRLILDQFTKQAVPFSQMQNHSPELLLAASQVGPEDNVLDVACGPGLMACAFAKVARHVTGIDLTPAMIDQAKVLQQSHGLTNLAWHLGDVLLLPFPDDSFSLVFTRYSFHHFLDPKAVLAEMVRVCLPGGRVVVADVYTSNPQQAEAYNRLEKLRDPSHVRALAVEELTNLFDAAGLQIGESPVLQARIWRGGHYPAFFPQPRRCRPTSPNVCGRPGCGSPGRRCSSQGRQALFCLSGRHSRRPQAEGMTRKT